jgi:uncharacterized membrane protein
MKTAAKLLIILMLLIIIVPAIALSYGQSTTPSSAQDATYSAYKAILKASSAGADTNQLIQQLNQAVNLTSQAQQLAATNPKQAQALADQAQIIAQNVTQQAIASQQSASNVLPIISVTTAATLIVAGILVYAFGPKLIWRIWFNLRKNYRIKTKNPLSNNKLLVITAEQLCAIVLGATIIIAFFSVSLIIFPKNQGEQFSELGVLGPNMKLGDYPHQVVASDTVNLYCYVGNQMGNPMYYTIMVKLGNNDTAVNPAPIAPIQQFSQVLPNNQTWTFPVNVTLTQPGLNQRIIFELYIYNQTLNQNQYQETWGQVWLNVTAPAT